MTLDGDLVAEAVALTDRDASTYRSALEKDRLLDRFVAEFVAASASLEGHDSTPSEVLDSVRDLILG